MWPQSYIPFFSHLYNGEFYLLYLLGSVTWYTVYKELYNLRKHFYYSTELKNARLQALEITHLCLVLPESLGLSPCRISVSWLLKTASHGTVQSTVPILWVYGGTQVKVESLIENLTVLCDVLWYFTFWKKIMIGNVEFGCHGYYKLSSHY